MPTPPSVREPTTPQYSDEEGSHQSQSESFGDVSSEGSTYSPPKKKKERKKERKTQLRQKPQRNRQVQKNKKVGKKNFQLMQWWRETKD